MGIEILVSVNSWNEIRTTKYYSYCQMWYLVLVIVASAQRLLDCVLSCITSRVSIDFMCCGQHMHTLASFIDVSNWWMIHWQHYPDDAYKFVCLFIKFLLLLQGQACNGNCFFIGMRCNGYNMDLWYNIRIWIWYYFGHCVLILSFFWWLFIIQLVLRILIFSYLPCLLLS